MASESRDKGQETPVARHGLIACLLILPSAACGQARETGHPSLVRKADVLIWDEQYLRGPPKGWTVPAGYHAAFGGGRAIEKGIRFGRFGILSGRFLYTT